MQRKIDTAWQALFRFASYLAYVSLAGLIIMTLATLVDVTARFLINKPMHGLTDIYILAMPIVIAGCFPSGMALKSNITIRFLGGALGVKSSHWLETVGHLVMSLFVAVITWQLWLFASSLTTRETPILEVSLQPTWMVATALVAIALLLEIFNFVFALLVALGIVHSDQADKEDGDTSIQLH